MGTTEGTPSGEIIDSRFDLGESTDVQAFFDRMSGIYTKPMPATEMPTRTALLDGQPGLSPAERFDASFRS